MAGVGAVKTSDGDGDESPEAVERTRQRVQRRGERLVRVKFTQATRHPDYGEIAEGEVLEVEFNYAEEYWRLGFAEDSTERLSRPSAAAKDK
jgi:hypothetical protein